MPRAPSPAQGPPVDFPTVSPPLGLSGRARCVSPRSPYMWGKIAGSACTVGRDYPLWWADYNGVSAARARPRMVAGGERGRCGVPLRPNPTASAALALAFAGAGLAPLRRVRRLAQAGYPPVRGQRRCLRRVVRQELLLSTARVSGAPQHVCAPRFSPCNGLSGGCDAPGLASARARAAVWRGLVCAWPVALSRNTDHSSRHWRGGERTAWHRRATRRAQDRALAPGLRDRSHVPSGGLARPGSRSVWARRQRRRRQTSTWPRDARALFAALVVESRCFRMRTQSILLALAAAALVPSALAT